MGLLSVKNLTGFSSKTKSVSPPSSPTKPATSPTPATSPRPTSRPSKDSKKNKDKERTAVEQHLDELLATAVSGSSSLEVVQFLLTHGAAPPNGARTDADTDERSVVRGHAWVDIIDAAALSDTADAADKADLMIRKSGYNGLVPAEWIDYAIRHDKIGALRAILQQHSSSSKNYYYRPNDATCEHLHVAVDTDTPNLEILKLLLELRVEDVNKIPKKDNRPYAGEAPIHVATRRGCPQAVSMLRQHGANVDLRGKNYRRTVSLLQYWTVLVRFAHLHFLTFFAHNDRPFIWRCIPKMEKPT